MKDFPVFCYQSTSELYRYPSGGIPKGEAVTFRVKIRRDTFAYHVYFVCQKEGGASYRLSMPWSGLDNGYNVYELNFPVDESGLYFYHFEVDYYGNYVRYGKGEGGFALAQQNPVNFQITCYQPWQTPDWYTGGVMYQIFPDRFCKGEGAVEEKELRAWGDTPEYLPKKGVITNDDFFGGNLWGVIERLPYLKELGVTTLYLNPIFKARSNHRYDTGDYMQVDGLLGGNEAFLALVEKAHKLKMRVVLDGVFNHTGDDSLYFNKYGNYDSIGAYQSKASPYHSWFQFTQFPDKYTSWWGIDTLPSANKSNKGYRRFITGVVRHWLKKGADGWRLDVVDELPADFTDEIRAASREEKSDSLLIGEVWEDASNKIAYAERKRYFLGSQLDGCMNYPFRNAILQFIRLGSAQIIGNIVDNILDHYPKQAVDCLMNIIGTHDTVRALNELSAVTPRTKEDRSVFRLQGEKLAEAKQRLKLATLLQFTLPGVPCVYYGDEVGMQGFEDPFNRGCFPWDDIDEEILKWYKKLGRLRKNRVFKAGGYRKIQASEGIYVFERYDDTASVLVGINRSDKEASFALNAEYKNYFTGKTVDRAVLSPQYGFFLLIRR